MTYQEFFNEWHNKEDYIVAHTSGSTGNPKEIRLKKSFVKESAKRTNDFFRITSGSRLHSCVSPDFIGGKMMAVRALIAGGQLSWEKPSNRPLSGLSKFDTIDLLAVVPSQMPHILEILPSLPEIKNIIIGGSGIHPELKKKIVKSGLQAFETYGMTETASHIALRKVSSEDIPFRCLPGISVDLDTEQCLKIIFHSDRKETRLPLEIQTNDIAELAEPGNQFHILGRRDNIIISGGKKIKPEEVEKVLSAFINIPFYINGQPDEKWGQIVGMTIQGERSETLEKYLVEKFRETLSPHQRPKKFIWVNKIPLTPSGKIKR